MRLVDVMPNEVTRRPHVSLRQVGWAAYVGVNVGLILFDIRPDHFDRDWAIWDALPAALANGELYDLGLEIPFAWSPFAAVIMAGASTMGIFPWGALHVAALALLRAPALVALTFVSWGFWTDLASGNVFVFVFVSAVLALRGNGPAALVYLTLLFLMPRPIQVPVALWLLWRMPLLRIPAAVIFVAHGLIVIASGYALGWASVLASLGEVEWNIGPSRWLGVWWLVLGVPLAMLLTSRGRVGWAGLALSPYWIPAYLLMPLAELRESDSLERRRQRRSDELAIKPASVIGRTD